MPMYSCGSLRHSIPVLSGKANVILNAMHIVTIGLHFESEPAMLNNLIML